MTSNLGSEHLLRAMESGAPPAAAKQLVLAAAKKFFRPEFLNR